MWRAAVVIVRLPIALAVFMPFALFGTALLLLAIPVLVVWRIINIPFVFIAAAFSDQKSTFDSHMRSIGAVVPSRLREIEDIWAATWKFIIAAPGSWT